MADQAGGSRRVVVEVCSARNLMPKDGQGTASAYAVVDFDGQRRRTKTKLRELNPQWDERMEFLVNDPAAMAAETLEVNLYNDKKVGRRSTFLGKVRIAGSSFGKAGSESLVYYPLEKRSVFSQIKGEVGLKVCYIDDEPSPAAAASTDRGGDGEVKEKEKGVDQVGGDDKSKDDVKAGEPEKEDAQKKTTPAADPKPTAEAKPADSTVTETVTMAPDPPPAAAEKAQVDEKKKTPAAVEATPVKIDGQVDMRPIASAPPDRTGASDLVDRMVYLFARVLKVKTTTGDNDGVYAKLVIGTHTVCTKTVQSPADWDQVFAFHKNDLNATTLEVSVWSHKPPPPPPTDKDPSPAPGAPLEPDICLGTVSFELQEVPKRVPPDSPLAPQWYTLEGPPGNDVMLTVWLGTQADEAFQEAWQSDSGGLVRETRAKAYLSPKLWYLRLTVIQAQDLQLGSGAEAKARELYVKAQLGPQVFKTARSLVGFSSNGVASAATAAASPTWNEDLVFVAAEPFEPYLIFAVEDVTAGKTIGEAKVPVSGVGRRTDDRAEPPSRWFNLSNSSLDGSYAGRIHVRVCLEGGYHVLEEAAQVASDVRAAANQLAKPPIGTLEVGIRAASNLLPMKTMDGRGTTDAYVVAKYGPKWFRTRTVLDQFNPRWNEQYTWDVYDPCTVLTVGIFDNGRYRSGEKPAAKDVRMGKIRIRLSTLELNRIHFNFYPIIAIHPTGAKKMGELELAVRITCSSWLSLVQSYTAPLLPRMHYVRPLGPAQQDILRHTAVRLVTARMGRSEPPLGPEVVQHMLDTDAHVWSMRRSKSNWFRIVGCLSSAAAVARWLDGVRNWAAPSTTVLVHLLLVVVVVCPNLIISTLFMYLFFIVVWRYRLRRVGPPGGFDGRLSYVDAVTADELDEELDTFPSSRPPEQVRARYDRLRALAGRAQVLLGDVAAQGERVEALLNWRDPRATSIFVVFCLVASLLFYAVPTRVLVLAWGFYYLRHPRFRGDMPSVPANFFRRLPSQADRIL